MSHANWVLMSMANMQPETSGVRFSSWVRYSDSIYPLSTHSAAKIPVKNSEVAPQHLKIFLWVLPWKVPVKIFHLIDIISDSSYIWMDEWNWLNRIAQNRSFHECLKYFPRTCNFIPLKRSCLLGMKVCYMAQRYSWHATVYWSSSLSICEGTWSK